MEAKFQIPNVDVKYSNIIIDHKTKKATIEVRTRKAGGKRWSKANIIECYVTQATLDWFLNKFNDKDGNTTTAFKLYLKKRGITFKPGILRTLSFESYNMSEDYAENPFKLVLYNNSDIHTLTLVNKRPRELNADGKYVVKTYINHEGQTRESFYSKKAFRRLVIQH